MLTTQHTTGAWGRRFKKVNCNPRTIFGQHTGAWSDRSSLWTEERREIAQNKVMDDSLTWMSVPDLVKRYNSLCVVSQIKGIGTVCFLPARTRFLFSMLMCRTQHVCLQRFVARIKPPNLTNRSVHRKSIRWGQHTAGKRVVVPPFPPVEVTRFLCAPMTPGLCDFSKKPTVLYVAKEACQ